MRCWTAWSRLIRHLDGELFLILRRTVYTLAVPLPFPRSAGSSRPGRSTASARRVPFYVETPAVVLEEPARRALPRPIRVVALPARRRRAGPRRRSGASRDDWSRPETRDGRRSVEARQARPAPGRVWSRSSRASRVEHRRHLRAGRRLPERRDAGHERGELPRDLPRPPRPDRGRRRRERRRAAGHGRAPTSAAPARGPGRAARRTCAC